MKLKLASNQSRLRLGKELGRGGEGTVYQTDRPGFVAKLYHKPPDQRQCQKLKLAFSQSAPTATAWPRDGLLSKGRLLGYLMAEVRNCKPASDLITFASRQRCAPNFDWRHSHLAAANLAIVVAELHARGIVCGDLNRHNALIAPNAQVTLIDADSFQLGTGPHVFLCPVATPECMAPELFGRALARTVRDPAQDAFCLAVLIFQLIVGRHPHSGCWRGNGDPPDPVEALRQGYYVYANHSPVRVGPNVLPPSILPTELLNLFHRCFVVGHSSPQARPKAGEWANALISSSKSLRPCLASARHFHYPGRPCQWCAMEKAAQKRPESKNSRDDDNSLSRFSFSTAFANFRSFF